MANSVSRQKTQEIAAEVFSLLGTGNQVPPFSSRYGGFDLAEAYDVVEMVRDMRKERGETPVGRKIGFTNHSVWGGYGITGPIWNYLYDTTVNDLASIDALFALGNLPEPRIEPEIVLHLASSPNTEMDESELVACVDWVAHGFEIVYSIFPGWSFTAADAAAACGVHGALLLGDRHVIEENPALWCKALSNFRVNLAGSNGAVANGHAENVLGSPVKSLQFLVHELARISSNVSLKPGELITTGTLTEALPAVSGDSWTSKFEGIEIQGAQLRFR